MPRPADSPHWQAVQDLCASRLESYGFTVERHVYETGVNVIGVRMGIAQPERHVFIGAHYDSVESCAGADDNASGLAGVLEAARVLSQVPTPRTLVVACWDEEEAGLIGSRAYAARAAEQGMIIDAHFNLEMIGYKDDADNSQTLPPGFGLFFPEAEMRNNENMRRANFIAAVGDPASAPALDALQAYADRIGFLYSSLPLTAGDLTNPLLADLRRSDHAAFWEHGYAAIMVTDTSNFRYASYHCLNGTADVPANLDAAFATNVVRIVVASAAEALGLPRDL
jgi:Zn-dependent M28 family amino/carboxypeptidase